MGHIRRRKKNTGALQAVLDGADDPEETIKNEETFRALWPFDSNA